MEGDGLWRNSKGEKYVGQWKNNKAHGQGIHTSPTSTYQGINLYYQGSFNQFVKQGYGVEMFPNGD